MSAAGTSRAEEFSWPRVTAKVEEYYGFAIRRLAATGALPPHFTASVPPSPRTGAGVPVVQVDDPGRGRLTAGSCRTPVPGSRQAAARQAGRAPSGPPVSPGAGSSSSTAAIRHTHVE